MRYEQNKHFRLKVNVNGRLIEVYSYINIYICILLTFFILFYINRQLNGTDERRH